MKKHEIWIAIVAAIALLGTYAAFRQEILNVCCASVYRRFDSPTGAFAVVVYRTPQVFAMPGTALALAIRRTKDAAVTKALQEFIARRRQTRVLDLVGKLDWDADYDYKNGRTRR